MVPFNRSLSLVSSVLQLVWVISLAITSSSTTPVSALPDRVFWDNTDWPSDLARTSAGDDLLEGTVLFAQSQIIPSNHGIENDTQPHLTALRKTLVMLRPHNDIDDQSGTTILTLTVRDGDGTIVSGKQPIELTAPEGIPKQDGWVELGTVNDIDFPASLDDDAYVVKGQSNLEAIIGSDTNNDNLATIFTTQNKEVEARTSDGSWVKNIYLPNGSEVPEGSKFQITCDSTWGVTIHYPNGQNSGDWGTKDVSTNESLVILMIHDVWVAEGDPAPTDIPTFPSSLDSPYVVKGQGNLDDIGNDPEAVGLTSLLNDNDQTPTNEIEIRTQDGSWVKDIYLPEGSTVPVNSKIQITCDSGYTVNVYYPNPQTGTWRTKSLSRGDVSIVVLTPNNNVWLASDDLGHNDYIFGHNFYTATLNAEWVTPRMTLEFSSTGSGNRERGVLTADVGGVTELVITTLDAGFLTEPRNEFSFRDDPTLNAEYFETTMASRLVVVQYETMHFTEIMTPTGKFYESVSAEDGDVYSGDMRSIGKILLSHGIDLANYGISSSLGQSESSHPFTCALLAAHNTVGMYQNGRVVHGLSGGNGMVTLIDSIGNEMSHEVGHNYGLGHYPGRFNGSIHRPADEINSSWGWDSQKNLFRPNFASSDTGKDRCLDEQCQSPFLGKYQYEADAMAGGGDQNWGSNRYTMYTPYVSKIIQEFLERKAIWDPSSSTGFRKYDSTSRRMEEFTNTENDQKVPRLYRVPVTTIVGYYDPNPDRLLESYIYPAMHGAYGFVYDDDGGSTTGTPEGCELVVKTKKDTLVYNLDTYIDSKGMGKFHVNIATEDEPNEAWIYCQNRLHTNRVLDGPRIGEPTLTFTVNGLPFADDCKDKNLKFGRKKRGCDWVGKGRNNRKTRKRCGKKSKQKKLWDWCPEICGKVGLGKCKGNFDVGA